MVLSRRLTLLKPESTRGQCRDNDAIVLFAQVLRRADGLRLRLTVYRKVTYIC